MVAEGYKQTEVGVIPEDWDVTFLFQVAEKISVGIASAATHAYRDKGICLFRNQNIRAAGLDDSDVLYITEEFEKAFINKRLKGGDLLTARTGYPGTTCIVPSQYEGAQSFTTLITRLKRGIVSPIFINHVINSLIGQMYFDKAQIGGGQKNVNAAAMRLLPLPLPPSLAEQEAIAGALSDADGWIESLEQLIEKKRQIKQGAMQELLSPWVKETKEKGERKKEKATTPKLKEGWVEKTLGELFSFKNGLNKSKEYFGFGVPIVNYMDVYNNPTIDPNNLKGKVSLDKSEVDNYRVKKGDVFFTRTSETVEEIGLASVIHETSTSLVFSGFVLRARPLTTELVSNYLGYGLRSETVRKLIVSQASYTTRALINSSALKKVRFCYPSKTEQSLMADILSDMDNEITALETKLSKAKKIKQGMMQELLTGKTRLV